MADAATTVAVSDDSCPQWAAADPAAVAIPGSRTATEWGTRSQGAGGVRSPAQATQRPGLLAAYMVRMCRSDLCVDTVWIHLHVDSKGEILAWD